MIFNSKNFSKNKNGSHSFLILDIYAINAVSMLYSCLSNDIISIKDVQSLLGISTLNTIDILIHFDLKQAIEKIKRDLIDLFESLES